MAAAWVKFLKIPVNPCVAAKVHENQDANLLQAVSEMGLEWPRQILDSNSIDFFSFDLVVCFTERSKQIFPTLPGNPAVIYWNVAEPAKKSGDEFDLGECRTLRTQIYQLVKDLFLQGYFNALVQARRNSELVLDNLHEGIIAHDMQRRIFFFNKTAENITGYSRQEIIGHDCHTIFPDGFCGSGCSFCDVNNLQTLPVKPYPLKIRSKNGSVRQLEMSVVPINNIQNQPIGVVASFRDMTREMELAQRLGEIEKFAGIIGRDPKMQELYHTIKDLADSSASVLIHGESGTGKELVAAAIHNKGIRSKKLFVPVNCGALPENLLEAELFGHVKGAFTGAIRDKKGRFELADGGTIFLDEIGDISAAMQVKLLRVLQDGTFQRVGGEETIHVNVRVISATHKNLQLEIAAGRFREDLFYRLCVVPLHLPPLRERKMDIPPLAQHFLQSFLAEEKRKKMIIAPETMDIFMTYDWPGNVRELQNIIRFLLVRCRDDVIRPHNLPPNLLKIRDAVMQTPSDGKRRAKLTESMVRDALAATSGNRLQAAKKLGVGRATLYRFLDKHPLN